MQFIVYYSLSYESITSDLLNICPYIRLFDLNRRFGNIKAQKQKKQAENDLFLLLLRTFCAYSGLF